jgi:hypothetical protein
MKPYNCLDDPPLRSIPSNDKKLIYPFFFFLYFYIPSDNPEMDPSIELEQELISLLNRYNVHRYAMVLSLPTGVIRVYSSHSIKDEDLGVLTHTFLNALKTTDPSFENTITDEDGCKLRRNLAYQSMDLNLKDQGAVKAHMEECFKLLQQMPCKSVAKAWIRIIEPKKQTRYPYKMEERSKPHWWPENVRHVEPDHLLKKERVNLLVHILLNSEVMIRDLRDSLIKLDLDDNKLRIAEETLLVRKAVQMGNLETIQVSDFHDKCNKRIARKRRRGDSQKDDKLGIAFDPALGLSKEALSVDYSSHSGRVSMAIQAPVSSDGSENGDFDLSDLSDLTELNDESILGGIDRNELL